VERTEQTGTHKATEDLGADRQAIKYRQTPSLSVLCFTALGSQMKLSATRRTHLDEW
jgi:hypothetical protein